MGNSTFRTSVEAWQRELQKVPGIGRVHPRQRHIRDLERLENLYAVPCSGEENASDKPDLRGWTIHRSSITERRWSSQRTMAEETWVLQGLQAIQENIHSERDAQELIDAVWEHFRSLWQLGDLDSIEAASTPTIGYAQVGQYSCHVAELEFRAEALHTIPALTVSPLTTETATMDTREDHCDAANQITAYMTSVAESGRVHGERKFAVDSQDRIELFTIQADGALDDHRRIQTWQVYRDTDIEQRGLSGRVDAETSWVAECAWSWRDEGDSYSAFQDHLDDMMARFRSLENLGNRGNMTQVLSDPLQIREISSRRLMGALVHWAECEIPIREKVFV